MAVVVLIAVVSSAVALAFGGSLKKARAIEALDQVRSADAAARQAARRIGTRVRVELDLSSGTLSRTEGAASDRPTFESQLPAGARIDEVRTAERNAYSGRATIDYSPLGISPTYAVRIIAPGVDHWLVFAGLTGQITDASNESEVDAIFAPIAHR